MVDRQALLADLQDLLKRLEADLLERSGSTEVPEVGQSLRAEYDKARKAERTAQTYEDWRSDYITQIAAAWVLSCVFTRFLEDNELIDPPKIAGPGDRLGRARDEHEIYFRKSPTETDREYLLAVFHALAKLPGSREIFGEHNPIHELPNWLSGDAAGELLRFFRTIDANSGVLIHDFTDPEWNTRFLGDLYQDLSEAARKKYALLQTPEFVEEFILDRTLEPALDEFGLDAPAVTDREGKPVTEAGCRMIDPACGSGHFLLGAFRRILGRWQKQEPGTRVRELVQRTLDSIHGVDINPFAVAIARFRLLLAALKASDVDRLSNAPAFQMILACGDSLYHGRQQQLALDDDWTDESHYFHTEDAGTLRRMLRKGTFHCVVANPPYITPKDSAANLAYRQLYSTCHMKYSLAVPFMERIFDLAIRGDNSDVSAGFIGQITSNSFMKREFGKKLIEEFFLSVDLTHVLDVSGAFIPGHNGQEGGTATAILFGRNRNPFRESIRTLMGVDGEPGTPSVPRDGLVWTAVLEQIDRPGTTSRFISSSDSPRESFASHPWSMGGGGVAELVETLETSATAQLSHVTDAVGYGVNIGEDDAFVVEDQLYFRRIGVADADLKSMPAGEHIRDYIFAEMPLALYPYNSHCDFSPPANADKHYWVQRTILRNVLFHKKTHEERGLDWRQYAIVVEDKLNHPKGLLYAFVATHNHFAFDQTGFLSTKSAPGVYLPPGSTDDDYLAILGVLASSTVCFWLRNTTYLTGGSGDAWSMRGQFSATTVAKTPLPDRRPLSVIRALHEDTNRLAATSPANAIAAVFTPGELSADLQRMHTDCTLCRFETIRLQEDLDWECYRLYGLLEDDLTYPAQQSLGIQLGERAFEIVLARKMARGEVQTTWFERHGSQPITELPSHWPEDYKQLVQRRLDVIESNPQIALIEQPEYKRRWNTEPWESQVERALKSWLLDRLESYFDFDGRMNDEGQATSRLDIALTSVARLADVARQDAQFLEVGEVYRDDAAFDVQRLIEALVAGEHVPLLPILRYKPAGLRKWAEWEKTWDLQRVEDSIDARTKLPEDDPDFLTADQAADLKRREIGDIPVPPKYKSSDFISTGGARYWALRGKLDVPKERWVSFPQCEGADGTLMIAWAGYDHLQLARAISAYYVDIQERLGGRDDPRLEPLLACLVELLPWLKQWHNEVDPEFNVPMGDYFEGFIQDEARQMKKTLNEIKHWQPPQRTTRRRRRANT